MKRAAMVLGLGLLASAGAQGVQLSGGGVATQGSFGFNLGVTFMDLTSLGGLPVDGRISADLGSAGSGINADALVLIPSGSFNLYGGVGVGLRLGGSSALYGSLTGGLNAPLTDQLGLFAEGALRFNAASALRFGVTYNF
ncbi:hypothetical protein [Deinococcus peraridilitoris]|uniref:Outer membrane protein beta-barrel domain-containing protein n=1 Tax=Deinococcus peraridilitoris (strain DSM 19664 / LMG 22246 / CIP 109416 / KR-200) TaxID=937777 RepID=K9ZYA0_DEIPD|nr:hypothetical protein [Deinococcus peraridilitoris]AFZ65917.1 hypothetical protein Deipe_0316 [Deinococcus peraridilitoris DSM 19664]